RRSKQKKSSSSTNSLSSYDVSRTESVRNTPIRANAGGPLLIRLNAQ
ncbi:unnamed protein product, partial [Didymodactylos carnosus]